MKLNLFWLAMVRDLKLIEGGETMKALTLTQPWASLVAIGAKCIETRSWRTSYRGALAIHAAKGCPSDAKDFTYEKLTRDCLLAGGLGLKVDRSVYEGGGVYRLDTQLPRGAVIAVCRLIACVRTEELLSSVYATDMTEQEKFFGNYDSGRWGWMLADIEKLPEPIPAKGALSLWEWIDAKK